MLGAWFTYRQQTRQQELAADRADDDADDRMAQLMREAVTNDQRQLLADFRADLTRIREERDARMVEAERNERLARAWEALAHRQHHDHNGFLQLILMDRARRIHQYGDDYAKGLLPLPGAWPPLPPFRFSEAADSAPPR